MGRQYADNMTPAKANKAREDLIEGRRKRQKVKRAEASAAKTAAEGKWTIDRLWKSYKASRKPGKSLNTDKGRYNKYLKELFGNKEPVEIVMLDTDRLRLKLLKRLSPQTVAHVLNLLGWIVNYGVNHGYTNGLSFKVKKPVVQNQKTEDLTPDQLKRLLDAIEADEHEQAGNIMKLALYSGLRRGEIFNLKWADVDFHRGFIRIVGPKGGQDQTIPLNDTARELLNSIRRTRSAYVFPGRKGAKLTDLNKAFSAIKTTANLPNDFRALHGLRHVYASMLASSGEVDLYTLQRLLTHKDPRMTQRYAHLRDETLIRASSLAGPIVNEALKKAEENNAANMNGTKS